MVKNSPKRLICLVLAVVFLVAGLAGCSSEGSSPPAKEEIKPSQQNADATKNYQNYTDATYGFSIKYPSNWTKESEKGVAVLFASADVENLNVIVSDSKGLKLNDIMSATVADLQKSVTNYKQLENTQVKMGIMPAQKLVYTGRVENLDLKFMQYVTVVNKKLYILTYTGYDGYDKHLGEAQNIIDSLTVQ